LSVHLKEEFMKINYSIIITDDDQDDQEFLITAVKGIEPGCEIKTANDGVQLLDVLLKRNAFWDSDQLLPDLIILDLNMPIMDGYDALKQIKNNDKLKEIPVFILTTSTNEYDHIKSIAYGAKAFYSKPMVASDLVDIMKKIFSNVALQQKTQL
jgi:CheY-like chemotaxis protein